MCRLKEYETFLLEQEYSVNTIRKYVRDVGRFLEYAGTEEPDRMMTLLYKEELQNHYQLSSVNSVLASMNSYLKYIGKADCCVRACRIQRQIFRSDSLELSRDEYQNLILTARKRGKYRLSCIMQTIGSTGIRIGELKYITVEALETGVVNVYSKGKARMVLLSDALKELLKDYCQMENIKEGSIFITRNGCPVDRKNVWAEMKALCQAAGVPKSKVFPHNLRHLFACCFYEKEKDLVRLADYLGHSNVETTRRYTMISSMGSWQKQLELGLLVPREKDKAERENTE